MPAFNPTEIKKIDLELGMFDEAKSRNLSLTDYIGELEVEAGFDPGSELGQSMDPFERQLAAHGLAVNKEAALVEDFFKTSSSKILFPEFINRNVFTGMNLGKLDLRLADMYTASQKVGSGAVKQIGLDFDKEKVGAKKVAQGAFFPKVSVDAKDNTIGLDKVGLEVNFSYEAIRRMQVIKAAIIFQRIGFRLRRDVTKQALKVLISGDGNTGSASPTGTTATTTYTYADLVSALFQFAEGHEASHIVMHPTMLEKLLTDATNFPQFQSRTLLESFMQTGNLFDLFGRAIRTHLDHAQDAITMFEKDTCLELYEEAGGQLTEAKRIIDQQIEKTVISYVFAFGKMFQAASYHQTLKT